MVWKKQGSPKPDSNPEPVPEAFAYKSEPLKTRLIRRIKEWVKEQAPLGEAFCVAMTFHVLLFPIIWFAGWALPWPRGPSYTTVIEINLENWPEDARPERIEEIYTNALKKARRHK